MYRSIARALLVTCGLVVVSSLVSCKDASKSDPSASAPSGAASAAAPKSAPPPSASTSAAAAADALAPDASGVLTLAWKVTPSAYPKVGVSVTAGDQTIALPQLDATSDGPEDGKVAACAMRRSTATSSELACGGTPHYNYFTAKLAEGALVISLTDGVDESPGSEKVTVVTRRPTTATTLKMTGPASPALYGNCRPGSVQRTADGPCLRQCLKGNECKGKDKCEMVKVTGLDGEHKVHACVPPGQ